jgi:hypothetical protein
MTGHDAFELVQAATRLEAAIDRHTAALVLVHELVVPDYEEGLLREWARAKLGVGGASPPPAPTTSSPCTCGHTLAQHTIDSTGDPDADEPCNACDCGDYARAT